MFIGQANILITLFIASSIGFSEAGKSPYHLCKERSSLSRDIKIDISDCEYKERCPLFRGQNTTMSITFTPYFDTSRGIERILTGKFSSIKGKKIVELPMVKPIDASKETFRVFDNVPVSMVPIKRNLAYTTQFTYAVPVAAAKGPFDLRLVIREKVNGTKSWRNNNGAVYVCAMIPLQYV
ncbi:uncharacterized protein LOC107361886 [Tetranychus urticae]|uniref:uncharacterized protein LOC107361886 n=1 Tax=Tetranychus urticae TaxID=32264 RepID=UPI00077B9DB2|nr:uncharacterized protein LOC107361886 [Tetranychus urticae]